MVSVDGARDIIESAYDFLNGDPENRVQEFLLAKETTYEPDEGEDDEQEPEKALDIIEVPLHDDIHTDLNAIYVEELFKLYSETVKKETKPVSEYSAGNINRDPVPVQYLPFSDLPEQDLFKPLINTTNFDEDSYDGLGSADFQAIRVRDKWGKMFVAFRKFTRSQIVGSSWKVKLALRGTEYDRFEDNLFALPERFDAFLFDGHLFVNNQGKFEDIFNFYRDYEQRTNDVLDGLKDTEITIHNADFFKEAIMGDRTALRKMAVVEERGLYKNLTRDDVEKEIEKYDLSVNEEVVDGTWGLILPNRGDKRDLIRILNDDNLFSESTQKRYQSQKKRPI